MALCLSSCSSHSLLFNVLEAAAQSGEDGLPAYENLWEQPSPEETQKALRERSGPCWISELSFAGVMHGGGVCQERHAVRDPERPQSSVACCGRISRMTKEQHKGAGNARKASVQSREYDEN
jgi:hypothetical protein